MRARFIIPLAVLLLAGLGGAWFFNAFERVPVKEPVGPSGEARVRHFLAAERFAERMGLPSKELRSLPELDALPNAGVLIMPNRRQGIDAGRIARLLGWVQRGGHLIVEAEFLGVDDPLLDTLGIARRSREAVSKPLLVEVGERRLAVLLPGRMALEYSGKPRLKAGDQLASLPRGKGLVSVATSLHFARNALIGRHDHAEFFWTLLGLAPAAELQVFFHPERLSLWRFLTNNALPALIAGFLLLGLWLWRIAPRFGPVAPDAPPARRRLLDHLRASGRYFWAQGLRARLVVAARDAALRRMARAQPDFAVANGAEKAARLAAVAGVSAEEAQRFISAGGAMRGAEFIRLAHQAQRVHSALEKGQA
jgi:hypothetical protein